MTCPVDITKMNVTEVSGVLREKLPTVKEETVYAFEMEMIDGNALLELNTDDLKYLTETVHVHGRSAYLIITYRKGRNSFCLRKGNDRWQCSVGAQHRRPEVLTETVHGRSAYLPTIKEETVSAFEREMIDGNALLELNTDDLKYLTETVHGWSAYLIIWNSFCLRKGNDWCQCSVGAQHRRPEVSNGNGTWSIRISNNYLP